MLSYRYAVKGVDFATPLSYACATEATESHVRKSLLKCKIGQLFCLRILLYPFVRVYTHSKISLIYVWQPYKLYYIDAGLQR